MHIINTTASHTLAHTVKSVMLLLPLQQPGGVTWCSGSHCKPTQSYSGINRNSPSVATTTSQAISSSELNASAAFQSVFCRFQRVDGDL